MTPIDRYQKDLNAGHIQPDACQAQAVIHLQRCFDALTQEKKQSFWQKRPPFFKQQKLKPQGLYLWGSVGRGKTYLMDCFFHALPFQHKQRLHFHRFMYQVHDALEELKGQPNPLQILAKQWAEKTRVLCFDEFFVSDIADAMILARLLESLFERGVMLVATSNIIPDELYRNGLQRASFLPAIAAINTHCQVFHLEDGQDYRLRQLEQANLYTYPITETTAVDLQSRFTQFAGTTATNTQTIEINHRALPVIQECEGIVWMTFKTLCQSARSTPDYIEIARCYHTVILSDMAVMDNTQEDTARRFIALIDEFYERHVKLMITADVSMHDLYAGERLGFEFERCLSRLQEMQSHHYLSLPHNP